MNKPKLINHDYQSTSTNILESQHKYNSKSTFPPSPINSSQPQLIRKLTKQNQQLRQQIIQLKVNQYYCVNPNKIKQLITQLQSLKSSNRELAHKYQQALILKDFLQRTNVKLKEQCQHLITSLIQFKANYDQKESKQMKMQHLYSTTIKDGEIIQQQYINSKLFNEQLQQEVLSSQNYFKALNLQLKYNQFDQNYIKNVQQDFNLHNLQFVQEQHSFNQ